LVSEIDRPDLMAKNQVLTDQEKAKRRELCIKLENIWRIEEIKAKQRSRDKDIKEGDRNTAYFCAKANQRRRKKTIPCLLDDEVEISDNATMCNHAVEISDNATMCNHAVEFYKNLFGEEPKENIRLNGDFWQEGEKVLPEENDSLESKITKEEVRQAT
jgi:hypothetical protein